MTEMVLNHPKVEVHKIGRKGSTALTVAVTNCDLEVYRLIEKSPLYSNTAENHILHLAIETAGKTDPNAPAAPAAPAAPVGSKEKKLVSGLELGLGSARGIRLGLELGTPHTNTNTNQTASAAENVDSVAVNSKFMFGFDLKTQNIYTIIQKILDEKREDVKALYNYVDDGNTPLMCAAKALFQPERLCKMLLDLPPTLIDLKATDGSGNNALLLAIESNNESVAHILLSEHSKDCNRFEVNAKNDDGNDALTLALQKSMIGFASQLLKVSKINVNGKNEKGLSPLMTSLTLKDLTIAKTLLSHPNINLFDIDDTGKSILMYAAETGDFEIFQSIFSCIPKNTKDNATALIYQNHCPNSTCAPISIKLSDDMAARGASAACHRCSQYLGYSKAFSCPTCEYHQCVECFESSKSDSKFIDATLYAFAMNISKGGNRYKNISDYKQLFFGHTDKEDAEILKHIRHLNIPELMREKPDEILNFLLFKQGSKKILDKLECLEAIPGQKMRDFISLRVSEDRFNQLNARDLNNNHALYYSAISKSLELVRFLINQPEMVHVTEAFLNTIIRKSKGVELDEVTSLVLGSEKLKLASIGEKLIELCKLGFNKSIGCLITNGGSSDKKKAANLKYLDPKTKRTPLMTAIEHLNEDAVNLILDLYPLPDDSTLNLQCGESSTTALSVALNLNFEKNAKLQIAIINRLLRSNGVDCIHVQKYNTALMLAIKNKNHRACETLLSMRDKIYLGVNEKGIEGNTALHLMIEHSAPIENIKQIISMKEDQRPAGNINFSCEVDVLNDKGFTPLALAIDIGFGNGVKALLDNGATIDFQHKSSYISAAILKHKEPIRRNYTFKDCPTACILTLLLENQAAKNHDLAPLTIEALDVLFENSRIKSDGTYFRTTSNSWSELMKISDVRKYYFKILKSHIIPKFAVSPNTEIVEKFFLALLNSMSSNSKDPASHQGLYTAATIDEETNPNNGGFCIVKNFQIFVKVPLIHKAGCIKTSSLSINLNDTIADIKTKIWEKDYPERGKEFINKIFMTYGGKLLDENLTVHDYNIGTEHTLEVKFTNQARESGITTGPGRGSPAMRTFILTPSNYDAIISAASLFLAYESTFQVTQKNFIKKKLLSWFLNISLESSCITGGGERGAHIWLDRLMAINCMITGYNGYVSNDVWDSRYSDTDIQYFESCIYSAMTKVLDLYSRRWSLDSSVFFSSDQSSSSGNLDIEGSKVDLACRSIHLLANFVSMRRYSKLSIDRDLGLIEKLFDTFVNFLSFAIYLEDGRMLVVNAAMSSLVAIINILVKDNKLDHSKVCKLSPIVTDIVGAILASPRSEEIANSVRIESAKLDQSYSRAGTKQASYSPNKPSSNPNPNPNPNQMMQKTLEDLFFAPGFEELEVEEDSENIKISTYINNKDMFCNDDSGVLSQEELRMEQCLPKSASIPTNTKSSSISDTTSISIKQPQIINKNLKKLLSCTLKLVKSVWESSRALGPDQHVEGIKMWRYYENCSS